MLEEAAFGKQACDRRALRDYLEAFAESARTIAALGGPQAEGRFGLGHSYLKQETAYKIDSQRRWPLTFGPEDRGRLDAWLVAWGF